MDDKLTAKTAKFTSLKNLYVYGICHSFRSKSPLTSCTLLTRHRASVLEVGMPCTKLTKTDWFVMLQ